MALVTRCPQCRTAFKVVADQLRVRNGLVRCGACNTVFDGRACLVPSGSPAAGEAGSSVSQTRPGGEDRASPMPPHARFDDGQASSMAQPTYYGQQPANPQAPPAHEDAAAVSSPSAPDGPQPPRLAEPPAQPARTPFAEAPQSPPAAIAPDEADEPYIPAMPAVLRSRADMSRSEPRLGDLDEEDAPGLIAGDADRTRIEPAAGWSSGQLPEASFLHDEEPAGVPDQDDADGGRGPTLERAGHVEPGIDSTADSVGDGPVYGEARLRLSGQADTGRTPPEFLDADRIASRHAARRLWAWACCLGVLALAAQLLYVYRTPLAVAMPELRPALAAVCQPLGCEVGYARRIERISIVSSSLRPPQGAAHQAGEGAQQLVLTVVLRNRYAQPQHWPALTLDLTDLSDTVVARKVLRPETFLTSEQLAGPMPSQAEVTVRVPIEVKGLHVNGYQLDKFFP